MSKIEWTEKSWNPITGCTKISGGCKNCYAERMAKRLRGRCGYDQDDPFKVTFHETRIMQPLYWKKPRVIFVCSMGDLFHEKVDSSAIDMIFRVMQNTQRHCYLLLTKRPLELRDYTSSLKSKGVFRFNAAGRHDYQKRPNWPLANVGIGVSVEDPQAEERIPILLSIEASMRFVSVEPMLGPVNVSPWMKETSVTYNLLSKYYGPNGFDETGSQPERDMPRLDWVICGGETGPGARPMELQWARNLRDQCVASNVPFFFKKEGNNGNRLLDGKLWEQRPEWFSKWKINNYD